MICLELNYFEDWALLGLVQPEQVSQFSVIFALAVDWGFRRNMLDLKFNEEVKEGLQGLRENTISIIEFSNKYLDDKLLDDYYSFSYQAFIRTYFGDTDFIEDFRSFYSCDIYEVPHTLNEIDRIYELFDKRLNNFIENKKNHPEINTCDDPSIVNMQRKN